ncbi:glyoxylase-like metal-dependent hydrolase (beta-lactamase superfamily II) [Paucibacter oligotrophus]|uniref:Glyoxylase-like metal-dependent hydrolase (Beta-lactamase superfamily II) n=1 Tax=Roseateles oligotrophus TaxID=1769250 RepID=A0A840LCZ3_9BURK|nr:MBL fold metallo-hydrolase [Roseateles oligotrophus]MBB4844553.1 glyoxylase-like metal-dependent hydrolase (beta-lactamase superfamily II) [Roseateles oligotrophus]
MANLREHELHYPLGDALPAPGGVLEIAPGLRWVRMGLPFALDHINLWLLRDEIDGRPGWSIVDCGVANEATRALWEQVFAQHLDGLPVLRVIVTHFHPDHIGLAAWLVDKWQCRFAISATDFHLARLASTSTVGMGGQTAAAFFASHGLSDEESLAKIRARSSYYPSMVPAVPASFQRLMEGGKLRIGGRDWACIAGYGHAPEHMSLHCAGLGVLISGDMLLPRISTNVSVVDVEPEADPLTLYLDSIARLLALPAETLVLPSHGKPFSGLHARVDQLQEHHRERLAEVLAACRAKPCHAAELLELLFKRKLDLHQTTFAMGESVAHLNALWLAGRLSRKRDADGVYRFSTLDPLA